MSASPIWDDSGQGDLLALVAAGPLAPPTADEEWDYFCSTLRFIARSNDTGRIDPNLCRPLLAGEVAPQRIGAFYSRATHRGLIVADGWTISDDAHGKNGGKPARCYRWIGA